MSTSERPFGTPYEMNGKLVIDFVERRHVAERIASAVLQYNATQGADAHVTFETHRQPDQFEPPILPPGKEDRPDCVYTRLTYPGDPAFNAVWAIEMQLANEERPKTI